MNIVIAADKKYTKIFRDSLTQHNILGFENELKSNFVSRIADHYNPHVLIVVNGVRSRKFDFFAALPELRKQCPTMRIIYFFPKQNSGDTGNTLDRRRCEEANSRPAGRKNPYRNPDAEY